MFFISTLVNAMRALSGFDRSFATIEFNVDGTIRAANVNFSRLMGYELAELVGRHHSVLCDPSYTSTSDYKEFWTRLQRGESNAGEFHRRSKDGRNVWIRASYCPLVNARGRVTGVIKLASDVTATKLAAAENQSLLDAVSRSQALISFTPTGEILDVNDNFLRAVGYAKNEVIGQHHRMFVDPAEASAPAYAAFWKRLANGEYVAQEFRRIGKGGREVWIQAAYNPVFDANGHVTKVVKIATDLSQRMESIGHLAAGLRRLAQGDLTHSIDTAVVDTMETLRVDYNEAVIRLDETLRRVGGSARGIHQGTVEVSSAADDLAKRTEQQAASLEESAAALDQITATGKKAAEGANHARAIVEAASRDAAATGEIVRRTVQAMSNIEKSAEQITQIIGVIDEIAFQTNLLALNAGVEAARAGDAGRGFAVVASEVRALAQRSADAAKQIKTLISTSSSQVSDGVTLVAETGTALGRILDQVKSINQVIVDIASGAQEQATGLSEINTAINQMDQMTQQNAAMVEQSTAASHSLAQEADALSNLIGQFRLGRDTRSVGEEQNPAEQTRSSPDMHAQKRRASVSHRTGSAMRKPQLVRNASEWQDF